jgi:sodium-dependent dicarboxylate transporter 2/3/5
MLLPTAVAILGTLANLISQQTGREGFDPLKLRVGVALMLMLAYGASVGGLLTPVGSPPNLIGRGLIEEATGETISFTEWVVSALPICAAMFVALCAILLLLNKPEIKRLEGVEDYIASERAKLGRLSRKEKNTLVAFGTAVTLWIAPGIVGISAGDDSTAYEEATTHLDEGVVAILAASLLFLLPTNWPKREFTMTWSEAKDIDWGTILLFGSGIIFGSLLAATGLAETIGNSGADALGVDSEFTITVFAIVLAILISETTSNTASASIVVPIVIPVAAAAQVDPFVPALAATFAASFGFMLPVSTPQNAIVYGSGVVPITKMVRNGVVFDVIGAVLILLGIPLLVSAIGIGG